MPWIYLLLSVGAFALAFMAASPWLVVVALVAALVLLVAWVMTLFAQRVGNRARDEAQMLDPMELRRLREQAEARRAAASGTGPVDEPTPPAG
ncbi:hypothetical protein GCM10028862_22190 [Luteimonas pelagia]